MPANASFLLTAADFAALSRIAEHHGLYLKGHGRTGQINRTEALRVAIQAEIARIDRREKSARKSQTSIDCGSP